MTRLEAYALYQHQLGILKSARVKRWWAIFGTGLLPIYGIDNSADLDRGILMFLFVTLIAIASIISTNKYNLDKSELDMNYKVDRLS